MLISELRNGRPLFEMSYARKTAIDLIRNCQFTLNEHLIKWLTIDSQDLLDHWKGEIIGQIKKIARIRLKPNKTTLPEKMYYQLLYDEFFGEVELENVGGMMEDVIEEYPDYALKNTSVEQVAIELKFFHTQLAKLLHEGLKDVSGFVNHELK